MRVAAEAAAVAAPDAAGQAAAEAARAAGGTVKPLARIADSGPIGHAGIAIIHLNTSSQVRFLNVLE